MSFLPIACRRFFAVVQILKRGSRHDRDGAAPGNPVPLNYQPPPWLGKLLLFSLFVMLNTHLFLTFPTGIDQYSLFSLDLTASGTGPFVLAVISLAVNSIMSLLAFSIYCFIWRPDTTWIRFFWWPVTTCTRLIGRQKKNRFEQKRNPFKQFAVAVGVPVLIAMLPSILLVNTSVKPYFVIVGLLITIGLAISGALTHPDVKLDPSVVTLWYATAAGSVIVLTGLAVAVTLHFQIAEPVPPTNNLLWGWGHKWAPLVSQEDDDVRRSIGSYPGSTTQKLRYWPNDYEQRQREANLVFGLSSIAYMVTVLGGTLLYSISFSARRIPVQPSTPNTEVAQLEVEGVVQLNDESPESDEEINLEDATQVTADSSMSQSEKVSDGNDAHREHATLSQWGQEVLKRVKEYSDGGVETHILRLGYEKQNISKGEYEFLIGNVREGRKERKSPKGEIIEEVKAILSGPLRHADLYVHKPRGVVIHKSANGFEQPPLQKNASRFKVMCILAAGKPDHAVSHDELREMIKDLPGNPLPGNPSETTSALRDTYELPVESNGGLVALKKGTKVCFLDSL